LLLIMNGPSLPSSIALLRTGVPRKLFSRGLASRLVCLAAF
jgi:hypothetical protein